MITFLLGPAGGQTLALRRAPKLLRVVCTKRGEWDALDQLDDEPKAQESITVYVRADDLPINRYHVRCSPRSASGFYWSASYRWLIEQPEEAVLRDKAQWQAWATAWLAKQ